MKLLQIWMWLLAIALLVSIGGCAAAKPTRTIRPVVSVQPWEEQTITSPSSAQQYRYLYAEGPTPGAPVLLMLPGGIFDHRIWLNAHELSRYYH